MIKVIKKIGFGIMIILIFFVCLEVIARLVYPEFKNHIFSSDKYVGNKTMGINWHLTKFDDIEVRSPWPGYVYSKDKPFFIVLGDSISGGYGMAFEDIYWVRLERLTNQYHGEQMNFITFAGYGSQLKDYNRALETVLNDKGVSIKTIMYQFNFNDIMPFDSVELKQHITSNRLFRTFAVWRYKYINYSVFFRVLNFYAGKVIRKTTGTCEERGIDALGQYTWTFGSRKYKLQSEECWKKFEQQLKELKQSSDKAGARLVIFISPLLFDIDPEGIHPFYNSLKLDFSCSTINARERLSEIAANLNIKVIDPAEYLKRSFDARMKEGNFEPYFSTADDNHFTSATATYIAEYLFISLRENKQFKE